jgi:hypothetical protein
MFRKSKGGAKLFDKNAYLLGKIKTIKESTITVLAEFLADPTTKATALEKIGALTIELNQIAVELALNM